MRMEAGLVSRHSHGTVPPRVDYALTDDGRALLPALNELYRWGEAHMNSASKWDDCAEYPRV